MTDKKWDDLGEELKDAVNDAISSGDFEGLGRSIGDVVNGALFTVGKGVSASMRGASRMAGDAVRMAGNAAAKQAQAASSKMKQNQVIPLFDKHPGGKAGSIVLMAMGYPLMGLGAIFSFIFGYCTFAVGGYFIIPFLIFLSMAIGGLAMGVSGSKRFGFLDRFGKYTYRLEQRAYVSAKELSEKTGKSVEFTMRDLEKMIRQKLFYQAHLDWENKYLILSDRTFEQYQMAQEDYQKEQKEKEEQKAKDQQIPEKCRKMIAEGQRYVTHIRECNDAIPGEEISRKLDTMEQLVKRIFDEVRQHPEVADDLNKMMEYYLPMTEKLLDSYRELDAQPIAGENVTKTKKEIEDAVDSLNIAFEKLLDSLFEDRAWDISSDISVLNTMLAQEGLKEEDFK